MSSHKLVHKVHALGIRANRQVTLPLLWVLQRTVILGETSSHSLYQLRSVPPTDGRSTYHSKKENIATELRVYVTVRI